MRVALLALTVAAVVSGCTSSGSGPSNPNLAAPKLVVQPRQDGNVTLFVHGAFRDSLYDWINVTVDNMTLSNRSQVFSAEDAVLLAGFYVDVHAQVNAQTYLARARIDVNRSSERLRVSGYDDREGWSAPRDFSIPYEQVLDRPKVS